MCCSSLEGFGTMLFNIYESQSWPGMSSRDVQQVQIMKRQTSHAGSQAGKLAGPQCNSSSHATMQPLIIYRSVMAWHACTCSDMHDRHAAAATA